MTRENVAKSPSDTAEDRSTVRESAQLNTGRAGWGGDGMGIPTATQSAAERPSRASDVVAAYQQAALAAGNTRFLDVRSRLILGAQAKRLMSDDWPVPLLVRAAARFAGTQRNPAFMAEWVRIEYADQRAAEWAAIKAEDTPKRAAETMRSLAQALKDAGL